MVKEADNKVKQISESKNDATAAEAEAEQNEIKLKLKLDKVNCMSVSGLTRRRNIRKDLSRHN